MQRILSTVFWVFLTVSSVLLFPVAVLIWALTHRQRGEYEGGYVYNPRDGETYRLDAKLIDRHTLRIRGYLGIPLLGQTQLWQRAASAPGKAAPGAP